MERRRRQELEPLESPYEGSFFDALALGPRDLLVYGLQGNAWRSTDGGQSWSRVETGTTAGLMGGAALGNGRVVLVGAQGTVLESADGGATFTLERRPDRVALADAVATGGGLVLLGEAGALPGPGPKP
ncbi:WD40/YVTN/BNR-like repeat-containing protein [Aerophototrophica crusticola]|uniref:WD40/YVTN/BNR-like repeat-containing protein n=1 Tax=Aerophototrophica crusticola TaxID=1709002 RepID=UPI00384F7065